MGRISETSPEQSLVDIVADVGIPDAQHEKDTVVPIAHFSDLRLTDSINFMILGSSGFW